ncbi:MAG: DNA-processing protein DprA [bacterium]
MLPFPSIARSDSRYPASLTNICEPPDQLFFRGEVFPELLTRPLIAIVGTRRMTSYGRSVIRQLVPPLVRAGAVIVSGLALGCDGEAHTIALDENGSTIAVLGSGIDNNSLYPRQNFALAQRIIDSNRGAVISEFEAGTPSLPHHFPIRNRIIAGLCAATIVIEAEIKSGSLITAKLALEFGCEVFAVPGPIHAPYSTGTNYLIQNGAHLLAQASDVLERLELDVIGPCVKREEDALTASAQTILQNLSEPRDFDALMEASKLTPSELMSELTLLELNGYIIKSDTRWFLKQV